MANDLGVKLYLYSADHRAWRVLRSRGLCDHWAIGTWRRLVPRLEPSVILDVGANYGEVLASCAYRPGVRVVAFEPNPRIVPYLPRTLAAIEDVSLHAVAISDRSGTAEFYLYASSGRAGIHRRHGAVGSTTVRTRRVDDLVTVTSADRVLFKIDVEGHEVEALTGMEKLLATADRWIGLVEWSASSANAIAGIAPHIYGVRSDSFKLVSLFGGNVTEAALPSKSGFTKDVVISSHPLPSG